MWVSLGGSLFSDWTHPITGEPIPRSNSTSLGGSLFSDRTDPILRNKPAPLKPAPVGGSIPVPGAEILGAWCVEIAT